MVTLHELADKYQINVNRGKRQLEYEGHQTTEMYSNDAYGDYKKRKFLVNQKKVNIRRKR